MSGTIGGEINKRLHQLLGKFVMDDKYDYKIAALQLEQIIADMIEDKIDEHLDNFEHEKRD